MSNNQLLMLMIISLGALSIYLDGERRQIVRKYHRLKQKWDTQPRVNKNNRQKEIDQEKDWLLGVDKDGKMQQY